MGIEDAFTMLAGMCAHEVVPTGVPCCGMAGDRGLRYPELTGSSLQHMNLPKDCKGVWGYLACWAVTLAPTLQACGGPAQAGNKANEQENESCIRDTFHPPRAGPYLCVNRSCCFLSEVGYGHTSTRQVVCMSVHISRTPVSCSVSADGYSTSRTCEMSLSNHAGINFRGMVYLIDEATKAKKVADSSAHAA
eukprot:1147032-Pelagomonas_calceolata.AAC.1